MKTNNSKKSVCRDHSFSFINLIVFIACLFINNLALADECLLAKQLNDPYIRAEYEAVIAENRTNGMNQDVEDFYGNTQPVSFSETPMFSAQGRSNPYDTISLECIACHDGLTARAANHRISNGNRQGVKSMETIKAAHPFGMDYDHYKSNKGYVPVDMLPADMVLMGGKVVCVTCHNMLGENKMFLAVDNSGSRLCFSCHVK